MSERFTEILDFCEVSVNPSLGNVFFRVWNKYKALWGKADQKHGLVYEIDDRGEVLYLYVGPLTPISSGGPITKIGVYEKFTYL